MSRICSDDPTHASNTDDFCSICGAPVNGQNVRQQSTQAFSSAVGSSACPTCGIASVPGDVFCANCGTEYATGRMIMPEPEPEAALHSATSAITSVSDSKTQADMASVNSPFRAILLIDLAPREGREIDALPPADCSERVFILDKEILPFGRTSSWMPIPDEGASRSHGEFLRHADELWIARCRLSQRHIVERRPP